MSAHLIPHVPLCFLSLGTQLGCEPHLVYCAHLNLSVHRFLYPFYFFLQKYVNLIVRHLQFQR